MLTYVSLGENCLPDDVLSYTGLKRESYPFGSGRFNIEYIHQVIESDFKDLLNPEYLVEAFTDNKVVIRNTLYQSINDIYCPTVSVPFEFTHHNVLQGAAHKSYSRKIVRFKELLQSKTEIVFVYHYRYNDKMNPKIMVGLLQKFLVMLTDKYKRSFKCVLWYQQLGASEKSVEVRQDGNILIGQFNSLIEWEGDEHWNGMIDRDLFLQFFNHPSYRKYVYGPLYVLQPVMNIAKKITSRLRRMAGMN